MPNNKGFKKDQNSLLHVSERLRDDEKVVRKAIRKNGLALQHASERLRDDKRIVLMAVRERGCALQYASERLRDNEEVVRNTEECQLDEHDGLAAREREAA